jgi:hypothetical protein
MYQNITVKSNTKHLLSLVFYVHTQIKINEKKGTKMSTTEKNMRQTESFLIVLVVLLF